MMIEPGDMRHRCTFEQHDGTLDGAGQPTYTTAGDWDPIISDWPCKLQSTAGGERIRGRQVTAETTHVLFGHFSFAQTATADMRAVVTSSTTGVATTYQVVSVLDMDGEGRELRVELRREV